MTAPARVALEPAYVLHHRLYRDTSLLLEVFTAGHGRIGLVARGARRPKSRLQGLLQPFRPLLLSWSMRRELGTLTGAEPRDGDGLRGRALISGFYVNELLMRLLHRHDPHPLLFAAYEEAMRALAAIEEAAGAREEPALRLFEKTLLREIGYGLVLDHEVGGGGPLLADAVYYYYPERGPVIAVAAEGDILPPPGAVRLHGASLLALARDELHDPRSLREAKMLMRAVLGVRLGPRPIASRDLFRRAGTPEADAGPEDAAGPAKEESCA